MPPTSDPKAQTTPSAAQKPPEYRMPTPPAIVIWRNAPGDDAAAPAAVTKRGKSAVSLMVFPPDSRVGVPKDAVRFIDDPIVKKSGINPSDGVWDYTPEYRLLLSVVAKTKV